MVVCDLTLSNIMQTKKYEFMRIFFLIFISIASVIN